MKWDNVLSAYRKHECSLSVEHLFSACPILIRNYLALSSFPAGQLLIEAGSPRGTVHILVFGRLQAIEEKASKVPHSFFDIVPSDIVGNYELFSEDTESSVTVQAREPPVCLTISARFYLQWINAGSVALFFRTRLSMKKLSLQLNSSHRYLLMSYEERCTYVICQEAGKVSPVDGIFRLKLNRKFLATKTGCSLRTIHRLLKEMEHKDMLALSDGKILLTSTQLENMMSGLDPYSQKCSPPRSYFHNQQGWAYIFQPSP